MPLGVGNLTAAEVAQLTGLSVHTLSYWRQSGQGPKSIKTGSRTFYRREDIEQWLADVDGRSVPTRSSGSGWFTKATEAAKQIDPVHTTPWKLASTYALLSIAESLLTRRSGTCAKSAGLDKPVAVQPDSELLTITDVAAMTRLPVNTLRYWRHTGVDGPPSVKLGRRVLYRRADVEAWLKEAR